MSYSEEEKKAIEYINRQRQGIPPNGRFIINNTDIQIILNLIENQKAEIEKLFAENQSLKYSIGNMVHKDVVRMKDSEIAKRNKQINLMAEQLTTPINGKEWVIEYYSKLAEEEK